jgi:hypothetical protein
MGLYLDWFHLPATFPPFPGKNQHFNLLYTQGVIQSHRALFHFLKMIQVSMGYNGKNWEKIENLFYF